MSLVNSQVWIARTGYTRLPLKMSVAPLACPVTIIHLITGYSLPNPSSQPVLCAYPFTETSVPRNLPCSARRELFTKCPCCSVPAVLGHPHGLSLLLRMWPYQIGLLLLLIPGFYSIRGMETPWKRIVAVLVASRPAFFFKKFFILCLHTYEFIGYSATSLSRVYQNTSTIQSVFLFSFLPGQVECLCRLPQHLDWILWSPQFKCLFLTLLQPHTPMPSPRTCQLFGIAFSLKS